MNRVLETCIIAASFAFLQTSASANEGPSVEQREAAPGGLVLEHDGNEGDLIVSRDGIVYWMSIGDSLYEYDIVRSKSENTSTIEFDGCTFTLRKNLEVVLDESFCQKAAVTESTMATIASEAVGVTEVAASQGVPLTIGGVALASGGIASFVSGADGSAGAGNSADANTATQATTIQNSASPVSASPG